VRATTAFKRLVRLDDVNVTDVEFLATVVIVTVALRRRRLVCPHCGHKTRWRYDTRPVDSRWRHLDLGTWQLELRASLRRLRCPTHGVVVEAVPFARPGANLTRDLDDLLAWLATRMDKSSVARLCRVSWRTVGRACERVVATELDPDRLDGLFRIGVDEISWRKHHKYLTLVVDHDRGKVIWGAKGKDALTLDAFFDELGPERSAQIAAVSLDLGPAFLKSVRAEGHAPQAIVCAGRRPHPCRDRRAARRLVHPALRSRLASFVKCARTMRAQRPDPQRRRARDLQRPYRRLNTRSVF